MKGENMEVNKQKAKKVKEMYGSNGIYFESREEAAKFNKQFSLGERKIKAIKVFKNCEDYANSFADDALEMLCREKFVLLYNEMQLPFRVRYEEKGMRFWSDKISLRNLQEMVTLANEKLKENHSYPQDVQETETVIAKLGNKEAVLTVKQCRILYEIFKKTCDKLNEIDKNLKSITERGNYDKEKYTKIQSRYFLYDVKEIPTCNLDMLEKDFKFRSYLELE